MLTRYRRTRRADVCDEGELTSGSTEQHNATISMKLQTFSNIKAVEFIKTQWIRCTHLGYTHTHVRIHSYLLALTQLNHPFHFDSLDIL